jgi:Ca-activated chloride channel family protein
MVLLETNTPGSENWLKQGGVQMSFHVRSLRYCFAWLSCFALALVALACASEVSAAPESQDANIIFIFDASGSMGAKIQGRAKIDTAKEVLSALIKDLPAKTKVGLVVYGHRQKGDCTDVEEVSPLAPVDKEALLNKIKGINPKGMTPLTYSLRKVAEGLKNRPEESTIILVSDGEETCKGDPCSTVAELRNSGIKFVIHVIGFDVNEKEKQQLSCIARAGGGSYFTARNAGELMIAARKAVQKEKETKPATLTVKASMNGKPFRTFCEIYKGGGGTAKDKEKVAEGWTDNGSRAFQLQPGLYDLRVENRDGANKQAIDFMAVSVEAGKNVDKLADFSGGTLEIRALRNGTPFRAYSAVLKPGAGDEKITEGWTDAEAQGFKLPPGVYDATVENLEDANSPAVHLQGIKIEAGKTVEKVAEFSGGTLKVKALLNDKPFRAFCLIYKTQEEENEKKKIAEGWTDVEGTGFKLTPGVYDVVVENQDGAEKSTVNFTGVSIEAAKAIEKVADFSGGTLKIRASRNGKPLSADCMVYKADAGEAEGKQVLSEVWTGMEGALLKLKPGVYDVIVENREDANGLPVSFKGIAIEVGKTVEKTADFSGGTLKVKAQRNGKIFSAECQIYNTDEGGEKKLVTGDWSRDDAATFNLVPGTYDLIVINREDAGQPQANFPGIMVEQGKTVEKTVDFSGGTLKVKAQRNGKTFSAECQVYNTDEGGEKKLVTGDWSRDDAATFNLVPGKYDLIVINREDAGESKVNFPGITVEPGKTIEKTADFSGGTLKVKAQRNGKTFSAECQIYNTDEGGEKKLVTGDWSRDDGATFNLVPGTYDLIVINREDASQPEVKFPGITIEPGKTVEKTADFSGGTLKVKALRNGKVLSAECQIYNTDEGGEKKLVTGDWSRDDAATFNLVPGTYDLTVINREDAGQPQASFTGITIEPGKTVEKTAEFSGGTLKVKTFRNGTIFSAECQIYNTDEGGEKKLVTGDWTRDDAATFNLVPGTYDLTVINREDAGQPEVNCPGITIEPGKTVEKTAEFSGGTLKVKALRNGKLFSANCQVYTTDEGEKKLLTGDWSREEGASFKLVPGVYLVIVEDGDSHEKKEFKEVTIEAGKTQNLEAGFQ